MYCSPKHDNIAMLFQTHLEDFHSIFFMKPERCLALHCPLHQYSDVFLLEELKTNLTQSCLTSENQPHWSSKYG